MISGSICTTAFAAEDIVRVYVNGEILPKYGKLLDGNSVIPMRAFLEKIGFSVSWDDSTKTVTAKNNTTLMTVKADTNILAVNGEKVEMPCTAAVIDGTTYLPVRAIGESAGYKVDWLPATSSAILSDGNDKYSYYEDTPSLLPELGSVVGGAKFEEVSEDSANGGVYYIYKNYVEDKAYEYGDILCAKYGYEYESMQLGQNYSKMYTYVIGDVQTALVVQKIEDVPYIYVYPDISGKHLPEKETPPVEKTEPKDDRDNKSEDKKENIGAEYYGDTLVPTFEYICGGEVVDTQELESGTMYVYDGSTFEMMDYISGLMRFGFVQYDMQMGDMFEMTYTFAKGDDYVVVTSSMFFNQIYILPIDNLED
jgi:hypothetical protein